MKIVSWQSVLTDHQSHTMRALQDVSHENILIISGVKELQERKKQGWIPPDLSGLIVHYLPSSRWWKIGVSYLQENSDAIHLFNGLWADRRFFFLLLEAQRRGIRTALVTEPYADVAVGYLSEENALKGRLKAILRPWIYKAAGFLIARRLKAVFAISNKAVQQFSKIGVSRDVIFPFGYFIPAMYLSSSPYIESKGGLRLVFVGSLIKRKGICTLVEAMRICACKGLGVTLDIYGIGDVAKLSAVQNARYNGVIPFGQVQEVIAQYDVLVLPSQHDGWGVVVNEALLQGVPVIVSDQVGAQSLVEKSGAGAVVKVGDADDLADLFGSLSLNQDILLKWKDRANRFRDQLSPEIAAKYLYDSLLFVLEKKEHKINNPWYP